MKTTWGWMVLLLCAGSGCWENAPFCCKPAVTPPVVAPAAPPPVAQPPLVSAPEITPSNAHEKAEALRTELDREAK